tara:strand:- start:3812 stop:4231 length:420 start_codon:yes stop_codon:yes gene_type:complete
MQESALAKLVKASLERQFKIACYVNKNHGNQYQAHGRPDIEGSLFGRHFGFELKTKSRFTPTQVTHLKRIAAAGGIAGGIVYNNGKVYFINHNQAAKYSLRDRENWIEIPMNRYLDFTFIYTYVNIFYLYYHGEHSVLS